MTASEQTKLFEATTIPEGACIYYGECGNMTPGGADTSEMICDECLDRVRHNDRDSSN